MWLSQDKKLCINDSLISSGRVNADDGILVSIEGSAVSVPPGPDADSLAALLGLDNTPAGQAAKNAEEQPHKAATATQSAPHSLGKK